MKPIRLDVFQDDAMAAPQLSRVLPAALYNYVPETSYIEFCNKINELLSLVAADCKCREYRLRWWRYGSLFWLYWFFALLLSVLSESGVNSVRRLLFIVSITMFPVSMIIIWEWLISPTGVAPAADTVLKIREECEEMTNRTPYASFNLVTSQLHTTSVGGLYKNPIERIEVSLSASGLDVGKASSHPTVNTTSAVTSDYHPLEVV
jgi:hypothetical protein